MDIQPNGNGTHATCSYDRDQSKLCLYKGAIIRNVRETTRFTLNCLPLNPKYFFLLVKTSRTRTLCCYNSVFPIKCLECKYVIKSVRYIMSHWNVKLVNYYPYQCIQQMTTGLLFILGQGRVVKEHSVAHFHLINRTVNKKKKQP